MAATVTTASGATWQEVAADRQKYRDKTIAAIESPIPEVNEVPLNTTAIVKQILSSEEIGDLTLKLAKGEISAVTVTKAFLRRAALAQVAVSF